MAPKSKNKAKQTSKSTKDVEKIEVNEETGEVKEEKKKTGGTLKGELVSIFRELDSVNLEEKNAIIERAKKKLKTVIDELNDFVDDESKKEMVDVEKELTSGPMTVVRRAEGKTTLIKHANSKTPFSFGIKDLVICASIAIIVALIVTLAFVV